MALAACSSGGAGVSTEEGSSTPALPPSSCDPGTMPKLPEGTCAPVGTTACADGFDADPSGWGCRAILPTATCPVGKRASLGGATCVPVDDCADVFPPPGASATVTVGGATSLTAAIAAAPAGGVVAVESGDYEVDAIVKRDVVVVGRCASKVTIRAKEKTAFLVGEGAKLELRSLAISAPNGDAVYAITKGQATLTRVIIADSKFGVTASREASVRVVSSVLDGSGGAYAVADHAAVGAIRAATVTLEDTEVRGYPIAIGAYNEGTKVTLSRSVVRYDDAPSEGMLANIGSGAALEITESSLRGTRHGLVGFATSNGTAPGSNPGGTGGHLKIARSELVHTGEGPAPYAVLLDGVPAEIEDSTIVHQSDVAMYVLNGDGRLAMKGSVVRIADAARSFGMEHAAIAALTGGRASLESTAIIDPVQHGIVVLGEGSALEMRTSLVRGASWRKASADGKIEGVAIGVSVVESATATIEASAIVGSEQYGLHAGGEATVSAKSLIVDATAVPETGVGGVGVDVDELARVAFVDGVVRESAGAAFAFHAGGSLVQTSEIAGAPILFLLGAVRVQRPAAAPSEIADDAVVLVKNRLPDGVTFSTPDLPPPVVPRPWRVPGL